MRTEYVNYDNSIVKKIIESIGYDGWKTREVEDRFCLLDYKKFIRIKYDIHTKEFGVGTFEFDDWAILYIPSFSSYTNIDDVIAEVKKMLAEKS